MEVFKERLKELRIEKNLSQAELAKKTGLYQSTIAKYETGECKPSGEGLIALAKFFGCTIDFLVGLEEY